MNENRTRQTHEDYIVVGGVCSVDRIGIVDVVDRDACTCGGPGHGHAGRPSLGVVQQLRLEGVHLVLLHAYRCAHTTTGGGGGEGVLIGCVRRDVGC